MDDLLDQLQGVSQKAAPSEGNEAHSSTHHSGLLLMVRLQIVWSIRMVKGPCRGFWVQDVIIVGAPAVSYARITSCFMYISSRRVPSTHVLLLHDGDICSCLVHQPRAR